MTRSQFVEWMAEYHLRRDADDEAALAISNDSRHSRNQYYNPFRRGRA